MSARGIISYLFNKHLFISNTITSGVLFGLGDISVQVVKKIQGERNSVDKHSIGRLTFFGMSMGPVMHFWYTALDRVVPGKGHRFTAKKILLDQLIASPFFITSFFMGVGTLEGKKFEDSKEELKSNFWLVYKVDWSLWPMAQFVNFTFVPPHYRVLYVCLCTLLWDTFLVFIKHEQDKPTGVAHHSSNKPCRKPLDGKDL